ncbi:MAG: cbb3-type cytochrome c oxidase subunit 3 [Thiohalophilus sp.]|jgi:cytochrome c oxidase cbb3-type subunit 4
MDMNDVRSWYTVVMFVVFIGIVFWAWSGKRKRDFNEAAHLPLNEPEHPRDENKKETAS